MQTLRKTLNWLSHYSSNSEQYSRQNRLIHYITWELMAIGIIVICLYAISRRWYLVIIISTAIGLATLNLHVLNRTKNTILCGHLITLILFITIVSANYLIWGMGPVHSQWFYVMPLLAASLAGMSGLIIYSTASFILLIGFGSFSLPPYYAVPAYQFLVIAWLNHLFAYLIIVTTLASLIHENQRHEQALNQQNYLLRTEKDKYHYLARFDHLTNLPNRRYFTQYLHEIMETHDKNLYITVFFIDLDKFKLVNDRYGHNIGDQLLLETSKRLQLCFRENDFIARLGGDEFTAVVLHTPDKQIPQTIAQRILHEFEQEFKFGNNVGYQYAISVGFATYPKDAQTTSDLIIKADLAMYAAKKINGNSYYPK